jgi:hypothetical protein
MKSIHLTRPAAMAALFAAALLAGQPAWAAVQTFVANLDAKTEVPPKASAGKGTLSASLDTNTKMLTFTIVYAGLTGPATMAHFHGPALPGANAPIAVPFKEPASGSKESVKLTDAQIADLEAGRWYVNVHTQANPGGEIRGQVTEIK